MDQDSPTVYVVQKPHRDIDLTPALEYGRVTYLMDATQLAGDARPAVQEMDFHLRHYTDQDYLLCIGDPAAIGLAAILAADHNQGRVAFLKWDRLERTYYPVFVNLSTQRWRPREA